MTDINNIASEICKFLASNIVSEENNLTPDSNLKQMGIDSYSIVEILLFIERKFGTAIPESSLTQDNLRTPVTIAKCVYDYMNSGGK